jgi:CRP/FNR family transcriptional regulator, cyclic AMP receptor protein
MSDSALTQHPFFQGLNPQQLDLLASLFIPCDFQGETKIFNQGDPAEFLYIVMVGEVVVNFKPEDGPPLTVSRITPGGVVGWSAALGSRVYTSGAISGQECKLLRVRGADLRLLCQEQPDTGVIILNRLAEVIAQRLSSAHEQVLALLEVGLMCNVPNMGD